MQIFEKMSQKALNHDLTLPLQSTRRELPESSGILEKGLICVELWSFYCSKRISVPMSYISWWEAIEVEARKGQGLGGSWRYIAGGLYRGREAEEEEQEEGGRTGEE